MEPIGAGAFPPSTNEFPVREKNSLLRLEEIREFAFTALELRRELTPGIAELPGNVQNSCQILCKAFGNLVRANWSGGRHVRRGETRMRLDAGTKGTYLCFKGLFDFANIRATVG